MDEERVGETKYWKVGSHVSSFWSSMAERHFYTEERLGLVSGMG